MWNLNFLWPSKSTFESSGEKNSSSVDQDKEMIKKETKESIEPIKSDNQVAITSSWCLFSSGLEKRKPHDLWNTVIFFPDVNLESKEGPTAQLIKYLEAAQFRIQICMFKFSSWRLAKVLLNLKLVRKNRRGGIEIKIITDADLNNVQLKKILSALNNKGVEVRLKESGKHMHHKFVIIDDEAILTGSLNWTNMALTQNEEDVIVSTDQRHVRKYMERFQVLWNESKPTSILL